jgi:hypothetical protein
MTRLFIVCEGLTEVNFVQEVIRPQIEARVVGRVVMAPPNLQGYRSYADPAKFIRKLLNVPGASVTTLIDLFKLPADFPGLAEPQNERNPYARVEYLGKRFFEDVADAHFWPHLQLHEFEALLFADLTCLADIIRAGKRNWSNWLRQSSPHSRVQSTSTEPLHPPGASCRLFRSMPKKRRASLPFWKSASKRFVRNASTSIAG